MEPHPITDTSSLEFAFMGEVKAGFPSPAEDVREKLDLVKLLVRHSASTFFFRVDGVSMVDADMDEGDILIVDRAVEPPRRRHVQDRRAHDQSVQGQLDQARARKGYLRRQDHRDRPRVLLLRVQFHGHGRRHGKDTVRHDRA